MGGSCCRDYSETECPTQVCRDVTQFKYWLPEAAWAREQGATQALRVFNREYLEIKRTALVSLRDSINNGIKLMLSRFRGRSQLGAGRYRQLLSSIQ